MAECVCSACGHAHEEQPRTRIIASALLAPGIRNDLWQRGCGECGGTPDVNVYDRWDGEITVRVLCHGVITTATIPASLVENEQYAEIIRLARGALPGRSPG